MKYFLDTEFIEDGKTIDLISIGIVSEDGRELYCENSDCDLSRASQSELLTTTSANDLRADIVVAGLPTEGEPLCDALIDAVKPHVIVIADSEFPATRRASRAVHERLTPKNIPVIYTRIAGAVKIVTDKHGWKLQTMDGLQLGY